MNYKITRRAIALSGILNIALINYSFAKPIFSRKYNILDFGAKPNSEHINTGFIQDAINNAFSNGGGTIIVPKGIFICGALFFKPKVNLHLEKDAVLKCSNDMSNFPPMRTRIEGHFQDSFTPALINANNCDDFALTGEGTLDGAGQKIWDRFWELRAQAANPTNFPNLSIPRARLALIENSKNVLISGISFKDSQFWNLHLYKCRKVTINNVKFSVPDAYKQAPSTDGIDIDSCQNIFINNCYFSVTDDCIAAKGSKGVFALEDKDSPPVENIIVRNCVFKRGHSMFTCGSEATIIKNILIENCKVLGKMNVLHLKIRPDTPQFYSNIKVRNIIIDADEGTLINIRPWSQYFDLKNQPPPKSLVKNIEISQISGRTANFGTIKPNIGQTKIENILLKNIDLNLKNPILEHSEVVNLDFENVKINGNLIN